MFRNSGLHIAEDFGLSFNQQAPGTGCGNRVMAIRAFGFWFNLFSQCFIVLVCLAGLFVFLVSFSWGVLLWFAGNGVLMTSRSATMLEQRDYIFTD